LTTAAGGSTITGAGGRVGVAAGREEGADMSGMTVRTDLRGLPAAIGRMGRACAAAWRRNPAAFAAAAVVVLAAAVRLAFINYGLPRLYFWDEAMIVNTAREMVINGRLWPEWFYRYPSLVVDAQALVSIPAYFRALEHYPTWVPFGDVAPHYFYLYGRLVTTAFAVAGVVFVYLFGSRVWRKPWWGVGAAAALAVAGYHISESRQVSVDVPMATLAVGAVYFLFRFRDSGRRRHLLWSAALLGAAVGAKYNAGYYVPAMVVALAAWRRPARDYVYAGLVMAGVFVLTTPGVIFRLASVVNDLGADYYHYKVEGHLGFNTSHPVLDAASFLWVGELTYIPCVLALLGLIVTVGRRPGEGLLLFAFIVAFEAGIARMAIWTPELVMDVLPLVTLYVGAGLGAAAAWVGGEKPVVWRRVAAAGVVVATFALPIRTLVRDLAAWAAPDPRTLALEWVEANVPWPAMVMKEVWNEAPLAEGGETDAVPVDEAKYRVVRADYLTRRPVSYWAATGAQYYIGHIQPASYVYRTRDIPGAFAGAEAEGGSAAFWRHFGWLAGFPRNENNVMSEPAHVYAIADEDLVAAHPFRPAVALKGCLVKREEPPHAAVPLGDDGWFALYNDARIGGYFTAPPGAYRIGLRLRARSANGIPPRLRVAVDGVPVADFGVPAAGTYWTRAVAPGDRRYHHLLIRYYNDTVDLNGGDRDVYVGGIFISPRG